MLQQLQAFLPYVPYILAVLAIYFAGCLKPVGRMYQFFIGLIKKPFARIEELLQPFQPNQRRQETTYPGLRTIVLLIAFLLALTALTAETENTLQALTALWGGESVSLPLLPSFLNSAMGWLFISVSALFGGVWLEGVAVPEEAKIFNVPQEQKRKFERFIVTSFLLSLVTSVCFYALRPLFLANPDANITHLLQVVVFVLLGVLVPLVGVIAVYILAVGLHAALSLVLTLVWFAASILADICEYIQGHWQPSQKRSAATPFPAEEQLTHITQAGGSLTLPVSKESEVTPEMTEKLVALTFDDQFGSHMIAPVKTAVDHLAARFLICSSGRVGFLNPATPRPGIGVDTSPLQRMAGLKEQFAVLAENSIKVHAGVSNISASLLHFLDCSHGDAATAMLEPLSRRIPGASHLVITACSDTDVQQARVQEFFTAVLQIPKTTIVRVDTGSDFAKQQGYPKLCLHIADTLVKLLISPKQSSFNLSAVELAERLGGISPVVKLSFAVAPVAPGKTPVRGFWLKLFTKKATSGSYADVLAQALNITKKVVTAPDVPSYLLFSCPFSDSRYPQFVAEINQAVTETFPGILTGAVAASGVSPLHPTSTSPFFVSVASFTPDFLPVPEKPIPTQQMSEPPKQDEGDTKAAEDVPAPTLPVVVASVQKDTLNGKKTGRGRSSTKKKEK